MRKIELVNLVLDYLAGGDAPDDVRGKYHPEIITKRVEAAYNDLIYEIAIAAKRFSDYSQFDIFTQAHILAVTLDGGDNTIGEADLPFPIIQLPDNMGIREITYTDDEASAFAYLENNASTVFKELDVMIVDSRPYFFIEKDDTANNLYKLYMRKLAGSPSEIKAKLVMPLTEFDDYDRVPLPAGKDLRIVELVIQGLRTKPQEDVINDQLAD